MAEVEDEHTVNKKGQSEYDKEKIKKIWKEDFETLLNETDTEYNAEDVNVTYEDRVITTPTSDEFLKILKGFKNGRAPGSNGICAEMLNEGGERMQEQYYME
ncbi:hypothetical protein ILUMI_02145 [Ignelater luminosus]|uniref:Uncharacterized protein n=1 Tax=Ignelater luminosus TaxID=2038154 RepID=A0A8K0GNH5_IGNLU|nr:hypothetical protein ILUMI_02145 [Ignelater luminosus]